MLLQFLIIASPGLDEARQELHKIISDREMKDAVILVFANKQDQKEGKNF